MTASILPTIDTGGAVIYRDGDGNPTFPPDVQNAYAPDPDFISTCELTALPADCNGRVEAKQINAIVSEMLRLMECWDPDGPFDCNALDNLCKAFTAWWAVNKLVFDQVSIVGAGTMADPLHVELIDCGDY